MALLRKETYLAMTPLSREQSRAARCFLNWSRDDLAKAAKISTETVKNFENGIYSPNAATKQALLDIFDEHGLEFIEDGVKRKHACPSCGYPHTPAEETHAEAP